MLCPKHIIHYNNFSSCHGTTIRVVLFFSLWLPSITTSRGSEAGWLLRSGPNRAIFHQPLPSWPSVGKQKRMSACASQKHMTHPFSSLMLLPAGLFPCRQGCFLLCNDQPPKYMETRELKTCQLGLLFIKQGLVLPRLSFSYSFVQTTITITL